MGGGGYVAQVATVSEIEIEIEISQSRALSWRAVRRGLTAEVAVAFSFLPWQCSALSTMEFSQP